MTRVPAALFLTFLLATPALAAGRPDPATLGACLQIISAEIAPTASTDDALFGRSDWTLSATPSAVTSNALTR